nr:MAG TPA: hypothetical protein [Caudoviricetes sp.]
MLDFMTNNKIYEYQSTNQVSVLLSYFDSNYVMDIVEDMLQTKLNKFDTIPSPNIVESFESIFKSYYTNYPTDSDNIDETREETYRSIIKIIASKYNILYDINNLEDNMYLYTLAKYMYDFFVSKFDLYLIDFYVKFLRDQKEDIYNQLNLEGYKKNKDVSTNYSMAVFEDPKLAMIAAHLPMVLKFVSNMTVTDETIYRYIYKDPDIVSLFTDNLHTTGSSIYQLYNMMMSSNQLIQTNIIIQIRLKMQMTNKVINPTQNNI